MQHSICYDLAKKSLLTCSGLAVCICAFCKKQVAVCDLRFSISYNTLVLSFNAKNLIGLKKLRVAGGSITFRSIFRSHFVQHIRKHELLVNELSFSFKYLVGDSAHNY